MTLGDTTCPKSQKQYPGYSSLGHMGTRALTTHGACGKTWHQRGNLTGHCGGCHETFEGLRVFDSHQRIDDGRVTCLDPATVKDRGEFLRLVDGTWRGRQMPKDLHAEPEED